MAKAEWPQIETQMRPWTRWWWLGSAVDKPNITRLLEEYARAGLGGVEITPIYGVQGREAQEILFLSPQWVEMLRFAVTEAARLGMGVDMATGTGWPFGGPTVTDADAEDKFVVDKTPLAGGQAFEQNYGAVRPQALAAFSSGGQSVPLLDTINTDDVLHWTPPPGDWTLYTITQKWAGRMVKRAAPGGAGKCINPFSRPSLTHYLSGFDAGLSSLPPQAVRCQFHDSFEYLADWSPTLFEEFHTRRGYDLREHLPALAGDGDADTAARVKTDCRETLSDLLLENFTQTWTAWAHERGSLSRNQAHGSPGNLLDLYGTVDIPETEIFGGPGDPRVNKFASSAAHVMGRALASSETCTWLGEHFQVTLGECKRAIDGLFAAGINHVFYHGTAYSPADAAWPGWLFYASTTFTPDDPLWTDFPALNGYITRCQSLLQSGEPDNDVLLFWPLHDLWQSNPDAYMLEIGGAWLANSPTGQTAQVLWDRGFAYDYVSDAQLLTARADADGTVHVPGGQYKVIVVPPCTFMTETTLYALLELARAGATVVFEKTLPSDVPGLGNLDTRRRTFHVLLESLHFTNGEARVGAGRVLVGPDVNSLLTKVGVQRETIADHVGVAVIRRRHADGHTYFVANKGTETLDEWVTFASPFSTATLMDAMNGQTGTARVRGASEVYLQLPPGASLFVQTGTADGPAWRYQVPASEPVPLSGTWRVEFTQGGPVLPAPFTTNILASWTEQSDDAARFAGTARYSLTFDAPTSHTGRWLLQLGGVNDSARVRVNGAEVGTVISEPFEIVLPALLPIGNVLEVDVTNVAANRIRDMDRRGEAWKIFHEINFVDIHYKPFDASAWPVRPAGLLGPVRLVPLADR